MRKTMRLALLAMCVTGCSLLRPDSQLVIKNSCKGVLLQVFDGNGRKLVDRLDPGEPTSRDLDEYQGTVVYLAAYGFEIGTNRDMGENKTSRQIPHRGPNYTAPSQLEQWTINELFSRERNGGCKP